MPSFAAASRVLAGLDPEPEPALEEVPSA
jgi:hypothetical protein